MPSFTGKGRSVQHEETSGLTSDNRAWLRVESDLFQPGPAFHDPYALYFAIDKHSPFK